jgi:hypothetical protein
MNTLFETAVGIGDVLCKGVIIYCGVLWLLGQQTQATRHALSGAVGFYIISHYMSIWQFLRGL